MRAAVDVPVLRKDFIVSEYQVLEARAAGADAVLLIVAALEPGSCDRSPRARRSGAWTRWSKCTTPRSCRWRSTPAREIIGVNNRNLRTLEVDVKASETLIALMPTGVIAVSESGLRTPDDLARLRQLGYQAFLVGERLMTVAGSGRRVARAADGRGMFVKICGITRREDAEAAVSAGADALGFVFWPESPRFIDPFRARADCRPRFRRL